MKLVIALVLAATLPLVLLLTSCSQSVAKYEPCGKPAQPTNKPSTNTNVNSDWTKQNGVFVTGGAINLRTGASTNSKVIAELPANSEVKYDAYRTIGQYTWLRQPCVVTLSSVSIILNFTICWKLSNNTTTSTCTSS